MQSYTLHVSYNHFSSHTKCFLRSTHFIFNMVWNSLEILLLAIITFLLVEWLFQDLSNVIIKSKILPNSHLLSFKNTVSDLGNSVKLVTVLTSYLITCVATACIQGCTLENINKLAYSSLLSFYNWGVGKQLSTHTIKRKGLYLPHVTHMVSSVFIGLFQSQFKRQALLISSTLVLL